MSNETPPEPIGWELMDTNNELKTIVDFFNNRIPGHTLTSEQADRFEDALIYFYLGMINNRFPNNVYPDETRAAKDEMVKRALISEATGQRIERHLQRYLARQTPPEEAQ